MTATDTRRLDTQSSNRLPMYGAGRDKAAPMAKAFGGVISVLLLGLYAYAIYAIYTASSCFSNPGTCTEVPRIGEPVETVLSLVGGLVSALVVAVLAITPTRSSFAEALGGRNGQALSSKVASVVNIIVIAYLVVWLVCGIFLIVGWLTFSRPEPALVTAAKAWLGLAVAAGYAYLGLKPA